MKGKSIETHYSTVYNHIGRLERDTQRKEKLWTRSTFRAQQLQMSIRHELAKIRPTKGS